MLLTFVVLASAIALFIWGKPRPDLVALLALLALYLGGVLDLSQALAGFADPTVIMIATLFVVGEGLSRTGVSAWLSERLLKFGGQSETRLLVILMAVTAFVSAFISNTGTVAMMLPIVIGAAWRIGSVPSRFLIPLAFAANVGGLLTLVSTPPNIIVTDTLATLGCVPLIFSSLG